MNKKTTVKIDTPLVEFDELVKFDSNMDSIIDKYCDLYLEKREQILTQRIIIKQKEKIKELEEEIIDLRADYGTKAQIERDLAIDKAIEQLEELKNLYDDNYTVSDKAENILDILKGGNDE